MRLRPFAAAACGAAVALATLVVACAKGTDNVALDEGGAEVDAARDVNVVPVNKDSSTDPDSPVLPPDDSGSSGGCAMKVVINELVTNGAGGANDEMVELYNPSTCDVPLGSWTLKYESAAGGAGAAGHTFAAGASIPSLGYLALTPGAANWTSGMAAASGQVGLLDDTGKVVDAVAYGTVTGGDYKEKTAATAPASGGSIGRSPNGVDTDNNKADFKTYATPSPGAANP